MTVEGPKASEGPTVKSDDDSGKRAAKRLATIVTLAGLLIAVLNLSVQNNALEAQLEANAAQWRQWEAERKAMEVETVGAMHSMTFDHLNALGLKLSEKERALRGAPPDVNVTGYWESWREASAKRDVAVTLWTAANFSEAEVLIVAANRLLDSIPEFAQSTPGLEPILAAAAAAAVALLLPRRPWPPRQLRA